MYLTLVQSPFFLDPFSLCYLQAATQLKVAVAGMSPSSFKISAY